jgi:acetolactate synthase-1/3 small subunit
MKHVISLLVENRFGVLARVAGMFSGRGYNIESLTVAETTDPSVSRMTIITRGNDQVIEQITKQLNKLIDVIKVSDLTDTEFVGRELALVKVNVNESTRSEILSIIEIFRSKVVDVGQDSYIIEATGDANKIEAIIDLLKPFGIKEIARTGQVAMVRGIKKNEKVSNKNNGGK